MSGNNSGNMRHERFLPLVKVQVIAGCLALSVIGCATTEPITLHLPYDSVAANGAVESEKDMSCRVVLGAVKDERTNRETLGRFGARPLVAEHVTDWIQYRLQNLRGDGYTLQIAAAGLQPATSDFTGEIGIGRLYARTLTMTFEAVVTLTGKFRRHGEPTIERHYRGSDTKVNWMGGNWEIIGILNQALDNALSQMGEDLKTLCGRNALQIHP
jgi:hypothetical protein